MATGIFRQGDVLLVPVSDDEIELINYENKAKRHRKLKGLVLAEGEATGHHHRVLTPSRPITTARIRTARLNTTGAAVRVLTVPGDGAELVHDEHDTITLPAGKYQVQGQREFEAPTPVERQANPNADFSRRVYD